MSVTTSQETTKASTATNQPNTLPQTGQSDNRGLTISGILTIASSLLLSLGNFFKSRKEG